MSMMPATRKGTPRGGTADSPGQDGTADSPGAEWRTPRARNGTADSPGRDGPTEKASHQEGLTHHYTASMFHGIMPSMQYVQL